MRNGRRNTSGTSAQPPSTHNSSSNGSSSGSSNTNGNGNSNSNSNSNNPGLTPQQASPPHQLPPSSSPSRVLRSTTERRRRTNLFSSFYPLLSRSSSTPNSAAASGGSSSSQPNGSVVSGVTNVVSTSNNVGSSSSRATGARTEWPTSRPGAALNTGSGPVSRTATRSPGLQPLNSPSSSRTPRGLSRVQRMYDEPSVRSHSSSRASSIVAANPSAHALANAPALQNSVEYMDVDMESVDGSPHTQSSAAGESLSGSVQPSTITYENHMANSAQAGHAMVSSTEQPPSRNLTHAGATRTLQEPTPSASTAFEHLPLFALSNPRGGTSISSSLLPIRPDSDDDDDMEHELTNDHGISVAQGDAQTQAHPNLARMRLRRNFDPAIVADLIHDQIVQSLGGAAAGIAPAPMERPPSEPVEIVQDSQHHQQQHVIDPSSDTQASSNVDAGSGSSSALNLQGEAPRVMLHRRRRRSSSMRGLLGFQPTDEQTEGERSNPQTSGPEGTADPGANTTTDSPANGVDRAQFLLSQVPFFLRIIADLGRSMRPATGTEGGDAESNGNTPTLANGDHEAATTDATAPVSGPETLANTTNPAEPGTDAQPRRRHTTIRLIQIGGIPGSRRRPHQATSPNGNENSGESEERDENGGQAGEDVGQTVVVLIAEGPPHVDAVSGNPSDESEPGRERHRQLSPWIVMTISGACKCLIRRVESIAGV